MHRLLSWLYAKLLTVMIRSSYKHDDDDDGDVDDDIMTMGIEFFVVTIGSAHVTFYVGTFIIYLEEHMQLRVNHSLEIHFSQIANLLNLLIDLHFHWPMFLSFLYMF